MSGWSDRDLKERDYSDLLIKLNYKLIDFGDMSDDKINYSQDFKSVFLDYCGACIKQLKSNK